MAIQNAGMNISFNFEYALTIIIVILVCNALMKRSPNMNSAIIVLAGLLVGYLSLIILNNLVPGLNRFMNNIKQYYAYSIMGRFNNMGYFNVWPPILAVLIIFIILLYNKNLG